METVDVKKIMQEIREEIDKKDILSEDFTFDEILEENATLEIQEFKTYLEEINTHWDIKAYRELTSRKGIIGKIIIFLKKVLRKMMKFYIEPIVKDQVDYNANVVRIINISVEHMEEQKQKIERLEKELKILQSEINRC